MRQRLVILGTGFGAFSLLQTVRKMDADLVVVSPRNHFLFTPLLASTTVGTLEFRSIIESIRTACPSAAFHMATVESLDLGARTLRCHGALDGSEFDVAFDTLVIGVGAQPHTFGIPGVREHAFFLKQLSDARTIRQRVLECLERADLPGVTEDEKRRLLRIVVVGGGPTGVEFAAEVHDLLQAELQKAYPALLKYVRITLLEAGKQILNTYDETLSEYTLKHFRRQDIEVLTETPVVRVEADHVLLKDGSEIHFGCLVWATGNAPTPFVESLPFEKDRFGRIFVDNHLAVPGQENIYALGDCTILTAGPVPATGQTAEQQGRYLGRALVRHSKGKDVQPFVYHHKGMLAYIGSRAGIVDLSKMKGHGFMAFLFWRSVYLTKLVGLRNRSLVLFDWIRTLIFGRDISRI